MATSDVAQPVKQQKKLDIAALKELKIPELMKVGREMGVI